LIWRLVGIVLFAMVLAVVVTIIRRALLAAEQRTSTAVRIQRASLATDAVEDDAGGASHGMGGGA